MAKLTLANIATMMQATCRSMDVRAISSRRPENARCLAFHVRLTNSTIAETRRHQTALRSRLGELQNRRLCVKFDARSVDEFDSLIDDIEAGKLILTGQALSLLKAFPNFRRAELVDYPQPTGPGRETEFHFKTALVTADKPVAWAIRQAGVEPGMLGLSQLDDLNSWLEIAIIGMNVNGIISVPIYAKIDFPLKMVNGSVQTEFTCHRWLFDRVNKWGIRTNTWSGPPVERHKLTVASSSQTGEMVKGVISTGFEPIPPSSDGSIRFEFREKALEVVASAQIAASQLGSRAGEARAMIGMENTAKSRATLQVAADTLDLLDLFDSLGLHPAIVEVTRDLFQDGHYAPAIFEAFKRVNNEVKRVSGLGSKDGKDLMAVAFSETNPVIRLNDLLSRTETDEQEGFKFIYMGSMLGIRNPKAHDSIRQTDPFKTLEYLGLASLLMRRIDERKAP